MTTMMQPRVKTYGARFIRANSATLISIHPENSGEENVRRSRHGAASQPPVTTMR